MDGALECVWNEGWRKVEGLIEIGDVVMGGEGGEGGKAYREHFIHSALEGSCALELLAEGSRLSD